MAKEKCKGANSKLPSLSSWLLALLTSGPQPCVMREKVRSLFYQVSLWEPREGMSTFFLEDLQRF